MKKISLVVVIAFGTVLFVWSQSEYGHSKKSQLDGAWELVGAQQLPKGARDIKIISGGHFIFATYDTEKGKLLGSTTSSRTRLTAKQLRKVPGQQH